MNTHLECLPCLARNAVDLAYRSTDDPEIRKQIVAESLNLLAEHSMEVPPPFFFSKIQEIAEKYTGKTNLYREEKHRSNQLAERLVQNLSAIPEYDPDLRRILHYRHYPGIKNSKFLSQAHHQEKKMPPSSHYILPH